MTDPAYTRLVDAYIDLERNERYQQMNDLDLDPQQWDITPFKWLFLLGEPVI